MIFIVFVLCLEFYRAEYKAIVPQEHDISPRSLQATNTAYEWSFIMFHCLYEVVGDTN
jgi:hypothetical protein